MDLRVFVVCSVFSTALMILFIMVNYPYYRMSYGEKARRVVLRTIALNMLAILIGWAPAVYFWPEVSQKFLLPIVCAIGGLACVGSRFIYHEIIPEEVGKTLIRLLEQKRESEGGSKT